MKLSVIVPVYNVPKVLLEQCISSIKDNLESFHDAEVFLINDGSTRPYIDKILKEVESSDSRIHYITKPNTGVSDTRNRGIEMAQGEYVTFIDSDDYYEQDAFLYMVNTTDRVKADFSVFGFTNGVFSSMAEKRYAKMLSEEEKLEMLYYDVLTYKDDPLMKYGINLRCPSFKIFRKSLIDKYQLRFESSLVYSEDAFFNFCYLTHANKIYVDNKLVYHWVINQESVTHACTNKYMTNAILLLSLWEQYIVDNYPGNILFMHGLSLRFLYEIRSAKNRYFTDPRNDKSFWALKSELCDFLSHPTIKKWIRELRVSDVSNINDFKNIVLLKLRLYWIFLITERRKRKKNETQVLPERR